MGEKFFFLQLWHLPSPVVRKSITSAAPKGSVGVAYQMAQTSKPRQYASIDCAYADKIIRGWRLGE